MSIKSITVESYASTLPYEMMPITDDVFSNVFSNKYIKDIFGNLTDKKKFIKKIRDSKDEFVDKKNYEITYGTLYDSVINKEILYYLLKNRIREIYCTPEEIRTAIANKKKYEDPSSKPEDKATLSSIVQNTSSIASNKTLYLFPNIKNVKDKNTISFNLNKDLSPTYNNYYTTLFSSQPDNIYFLNVLSLENEDLDEFKSRLKQELYLLEEKIKEKAQIVMGREDNAYTKIIYFVDNEKSFNINYFNSSLKLKKEFTNELNTQLNAFFIRNVGNQRLSRSGNESLLKNSDVTNLRSEIVLKGLKGFYKSDPEKSKLNELGFRNALDMLILAFQQAYRRYTEKGFKQSLSQTVNLNKFIIYSRFDNLDAAINTNELTPSRDFLYFFLEKGHIPKVGYFQISNQSKNEYFFVVDAIANKRWRDEEESKEGQGLYGKYKKELKPKNERKELEDINDNAVKEIDALHRQTEGPESRRVLIQIRYNYGAIEFKNVESRNIQFTGNRIIFYKIKRDYEMYRPFKFNMIDHVFDAKLGPINYYEDVIFDKKSLQAYLESEKKYTDKTRMSVEFLKINSNIDELKKYTDFIYDKFKQNINTNLKNKSYEEKVKKAIVDILFEQNGLIYIRNTNIKTEKEKEKATSDNYKIINHKYTSINNSEDADDVKKEKIKSQLTYYFDKIYNEETESTYLGQDTKSDLIELFSQNNTTGAIVIIQITKDVITDASKLLLSAECKQRSKRIKSKYYKLLNVFKGGTKKKKNIKKMSRRYYRT